MAYLGRGLDKISNIEVLDNITFDGSSSYSITKNSVAFTPNSAQSLLISIDGVVQATNFTVNSSTIDFGVAIPSTSVCNFFLHYGTGVMTVPSDGSVTTAKLGDNAVSSAKMFSGFKNGITEADQWRLTTSTNTNTDDVLSTNWERADDATHTYIGTGMSESSGVFTFPQTGIYLIYFAISFTHSANDLVQVFLEATQDNSSYDIISIVQERGDSGGDGFGHSASNTAIVDVTDTSNVKVRLETVSMGTNSNVRGNTNANLSCISFLRIGDT